MGGGGSAEDGSGEHNMVVGSSKSHVRQHSVLPGTAVSTQQQRRTQSRRGIRAKHPLPFLFKSDIYIYMCVVLFYNIICCVMRKCKYAADTHPPPAAPCSPLPLMRLASPLSPRTQVWPCGAKRPAHGARTPPTIALPPPHAALAATAPHLLDVALRVRQNTTPTGDCTTC